MCKFINVKLGKLPVHQKLKLLNLGVFLGAFYAASLYPSAMWDEKSVYPKIETKYIFKKDRKNELSNKINDHNFTQGSAFLNNKVI